MKATDYQQDDLAEFRLRLLIFFVLLIFVSFTVLVGRFYYLQIMRYESMKARAEDNRITLLPIPSTRGNITDRYGRALAHNRAVYTLEVNPKLTSNLKQTLHTLGQWVTITPREKKLFYNLKRNTKRLQYMPLKENLSDDEVAILAANKYQLRGVDIRSRLIRYYPFNASASHVLGYVGRLSANDLKRITREKKDNLYLSSDVIGKLGIEKSYEDLLHGIPGAEQVEVDADGSVLRILDYTAPIQGKNISLTLDIKLQQIVEQVLGARRGAVVILEPNTGQLLAMASAPRFNPNQFIGGISVVNWQKLNNNIDKPLLNRAIQGTYPPGSTFKPFMALAGLVSGKRTIHDTIYDPGYFSFGGNLFRDSRRSGHGRVGLIKSIVVSSDVYYYTLAHDLGIDYLHSFMAQFGFGERSGLDLPGEVRGIRPSREWKLSYYKGNARGHWIPGDTISIGIGQGFNAYTPLQLARAIAVIANGGHLVTPHLALTPSNPAGQAQKKLTINPAYLRKVAHAMHLVTTEGTAAGAFSQAKYVSAGKTGTTQVFSLKGEDYDADNIKERLRDHSLYVAFAPKDQPKLVAVAIIENGGFGSRAAAPLVRKVFDYYFLNQLPETAELHLSEHQNPPYTTSTRPKNHHSQALSDGYRLKQSPTL